MAGQGFVKVPLYGDSTRPAPGAGQYDLEGRFLIGHSVPLGTASAYFVAAPGYRYRAGPPANEWRLDLVAGFKPTERWVLTGELFWVRSVGTIGSAIGVRGNPGEGQNFERWRAQLGGAYFFGPSLGVLGGVFHDIAGRNVARADGIYAGIWHRF
jgi:hypothetical protein